MVVIFFTWLPMMSCRSILCRSLFYKTHRVWISEMNLENVATAGLSETLLLVGSFFHDFKESISFHSITLLTIYKMQTLHTLQHNLQTSHDRTSRTRPCQMLSFDTGIALGLFCSHANNTYVRAEALRESPTEANGFKV